MSSIAAGGVSERHGVFRYPRVAPGSAGRETSRAEILGETGRYVHGTTEDYGLYS